MKTFYRHLLVLILILIILFSPVYSQGLPITSPESVSLSSERLNRISMVMQDYINRNKLAGAVALVARHGKIAYLETFGMMDIEANKPMSTDAIFRIASMTKPITSTAVMMLYEEGKFLLSDNISKYIPEFKNPRVLVPSSSDDSFTIIPSKNEITIRNLLNHTAGISYQWNKWLGKLYHDAGITHGLVQDESTIGEKVKILAGLPLVHHPGEAWHYGLNIDVLGYFVEVVSGMTLDEFFRERIFKPLRMKDTHFFLPEEKVSRLADVYTFKEDGTLIKMQDTPTVEDAFVYSKTYPYQGPRSYFSGGGGLCSTISDYVRFCQMILNGGKLDGVRLLSRKTVELMTSNSIGDLHISEQPGRKFGFGFGVRIERDEKSELQSLGTSGWGGFWYTHMWIDPEEELIGIIMSQLRNSKEPILNKFEILATQAITD